MNKRYKQKLPDYLEKYTEYIINLQGKDFITFKGLLAMAHDQGLKGIETELVSIDKDRTEEEKNGKTYITNATGLTIFKAKVVGEKGMFSAYGDASPRNVGKMIAPHLIRMAETRSVARALRFYTGCGYTCSDELE